MESASSPASRRTPDARGHHDSRRVVPTPRQARGRDGDLPVDRTDCVRETCVLMVVPQRQRNRRVEVLAAAAGRRLPRSARPGASDPGSCSFDGSRARPRAKMTEHDSRTMLGPLQLRSYKAARTRRPRPETRGFPGLPAWQRRGYGYATPISNEASRSRSFARFVHGIASRRSRSRHRGAAMLAGAVAMTLAMLAQGRGHRLETRAPAPFRSPLDGSRGSRRTAHQLSPLRALRRLRARVRR